MSDSDVAAAVWPGFPDALADTGTCPSCFTHLTAMTCSHCGLVLADPRSPRILELGRRIAALEAERQGLIEAIRFVHRFAPEPTVPTAPVAAIEPDAVIERESELAATPQLELAESVSTRAVAIDVSETAAVGAPDADAAPVMTDAPPPRAPIAPAPAKPPRRRLTVPVLLLIVGVSLVGIAAIFFLVLAWNLADIRVKSLIIGAVTLATMVAAALLRRWSLTATAEGIGALGIILLGLDGWAVRANDLFGAGGMDAVVYAGVAALTLGAICRLWALASRLRGPDIAATLALPAGLGLLLAGLVPLETAGAIAVGCLGAAVGGLAHALPSPWSAARTGADAVPERTALAIIGVAALLGAAVVLLIGLESMAVQLGVAAAVVGVSATYALILRPRTDVEALPASRALAGAAGAVAGAVTASLGWQMATQNTLPVYAELVTPVIAVLVAVGLDRWARRGDTLLAARIASALVAALVIIDLLVASTTRAQQALGMDWVVWETPVLTPAIGSDVGAAVLAAVAAVIVAMLLFLAPTLDRPRVREVRPIAAAALVLAGATGTGIPILIVATAVVIAAVALVGLARSDAGAGWSVVAGIAALTAFLAGLATPWLWGIGVAVAVAVPITARVLARPKTLGAVLLALAPVAVGAAAAFIAPTAIGAAFDLEVDAAAGLVLLQWVAVGVLACAAILRLDAPSRTGLAISSYGLLGISLLVLLIERTGDGSTSAALGEPALAIVRASVLLVVLTAVALVRTRIDALPSLGAAVFLAPAAASIVVAALEVAPLADAGWTALVVAATAAAVVWLGALAPHRAYGIAEVPLRTAAPPDKSAEQPQPAPSPPPYAQLARRCADIGALGTVVAAAGALHADFLWAFLLIIGFGLAAASVTRGWAAPAEAGAGDVPETRAGGLPLSRAPRRLLAWPAFAAATLGLWAWLATAGSFEIEAYALPPAFGMIGFAALLVWLRRQREATIALVAALVLSLVLPAIVSVADGSDSPVRGTVVAILAAAVALALAWTPIRRARVPAIAGGLTALVAVGVVAVDRSLDDPAGTAWLLLLIGAAYVSAWGFARGLPRSSPESANTQGIGTFTPRAFAAVVPPTALAVSTMAVLTSLDEGVVVAVGIAILGALHLAASALHRDPLGAPTRWTAFVTATIVATGSLFVGDVQAVELLSLPLAGMLLGGAALAIRRRERAGLPWPGPERVVWLAGLALAVTPSVAAATNDPRTWLVIAGALLAAVGCLVAPIADSAGLRTSSAILLTGGALAMGARALFAADVESGDFAAITAGVGALLVAATMVWMDEADASRLPSTLLAGAGAALLVAVVFVQSEGELVQSSLTAVIAATIAVGGAALLRWSRWAGLGGVLAIGGLVAALLAIARRFALVAYLDGAGVEPDVWALAGVGILVAVGVMALRSTTSPAIATVVGVIFSIALTLYTAAELILLGNPGGEELRTVLTMSAIVAVGIVGWLWRSRLGATLAPTAGALAAIFGLVALVALGIRPVELVTVPPALGMILLGLRALRQRPSLRTWPALGPGLALLTIPSLVYDFGTTSLWRVVALGVVGVAMVVVGAVWRLQAPLVLGSVVVLVHAVSQLWPWISDVYSIVPWWLWLGIGGALLIYIAARYERRMRALRAAFTTVTSLR